MSYHSQQTRSALETQIDKLRLQLKRAEEETAKGVKVSGYIPVAGDRRCEEANDTIRQQAPMQENLQRELALMSSAWYDITSRMQSDAVVVQRRGEAPRSFLNKQRRLLSNPIVPVRSPISRSIASKVSVQY